MSEIHLDVIESYGATPWVEGEPGVGRCSDITRPTEDAALDPRCEAFRRAGAGEWALDMLDDRPGEVDPDAGYRLGAMGVSRREHDTVVEVQLESYRRGVRALRPRRPPVVLTRAERNDLIAENARAAA